jgi:hypothetical protein
MLSALFFGCLLLRPRLKENLAVLLSSTGVALFGAEIVLLTLQPDNSTLWTPYNRDQLNKVVTLARQYGVEYDTRTQLQVVKDLRQREIDAVPSAYPFGLFARQDDGSLKSRVVVEGHELLALSGISNRPTVFCNEAGAWVTYQSDQHGFNNSANIWRFESLDVALLGDSFAHGACVPPDRNFASIIRKRFPATLNLGNSNTGPLMSLAALKEYAAQFRPKVVLWFLYEGNDFDDLMAEAQSPLLMKYLERDFTLELRFHQSEIDAALERHLLAELEAVQVGGFKRTGLKALSVIRFEELRRNLRHALRTYQRQQALERSIGLFADAITEAKLTVDSWGGKFYLVYLPERQRFVDSSAATRGDQKYRIVRGVARSLEIELIDIPATFQSSADPLALFPFRRRGHYNEEGHRLVGETVLHRITVERPEYAFTRAGAGATSHPGSRSHAAFRPSPRRTRSG